MEQRSVEITKFKDGSIFIMLPKIGGLRYGKMFKPHEMKEARNFVKLLKKEYKTIKFIDFTK